MEYTERDHVFAVCAYKESVYLEACIDSLEKQNVLGRIIACTATPNDYISDVAARHGLPLFINNGLHGIAEDWNFAYAQADAPLVTLAHQDDVYEPNYLKRMLMALNAEKKPLIGFSDYYELRNGEKSFARHNKNLRIKEITMMPLRATRLQSSRWVRRRMLSLCDPICCPAVTYVKENLPAVVFKTDFKCDLDWQAWESISRLKGSFCYVHDPLMGHRIHHESTTTEIIGDHNGRSSEDLEMYRKFWPLPVAKLLNRAYSGAQKSNNI